MLNKISLGQGCGSRVVVEKVVGEAVEEGWLFWGEETIVDLINGLLELRITLIVLARSISVQREREGENKGGREGGREGGKEGGREGGRVGVKEGGREGVREGGKEGKRGWEGH